MTKLAAFTCSAVILAALATQPAAGNRATSTSEASKVRSLLIHQVSLFNAGRWRQLWATYTPRFRSHCPYPRFAASGSQARPILGRARVRNVAVRVTGRRAHVTYQLIARGRVFPGGTARSPDVYVRIGGRWFDEEDAVSSC
jgi:hypothetical protein